MPTVINAGKKWTLEGLSNFYDGRITIFDENSNEIFSESTSKILTSRSYNVEKLVPGVYSINYSVNGKTFSQTLKK
jgi:hypothetical protein